MSFSLRGRQVTELSRKVAFERGAVGLVASHDRRALDIFDRAREISGVSRLRTASEALCARIVVAHAVCSTYPKCFRALVRYFVRCGKLSQRGAPNKAPTPAVNAIASAPQNVTRATDFHTGDPRRGPPENPAPRERPMSCPKPSRRERRLAPGGRA